MNAFKTAAVGLVGVATILVAVPATAGATALPGNTVFAGYQVLTPTPGTKTSVQAQLTVPSLTCTATTSLMVAGIGVESPDGQVAPAIEGSCDGTGPATYTALYGSDSQTIVITAGDKVRLSVTTTTSGSPFEWRTRVDDLTTGVQVSYSNKNKRSYTPSSVWVGVANDLSAPHPLPDFSKIQWSNVEIDGSPFGAADPQGYDLIKNPNHPKVLALASPLSPAGGSFTNTWLRGS
jgi:hypothetical protein